MRERMVSGNSRFRVIIEFLRRWVNPKERNAVRGQESGIRDQESGVRRRKAGITLAAKPCILPPDS
jgi:hypothetical protein